MKKSLIYALIFASLAYASCIDKPTYPSEPVIAYKDFIRYGTDPSDPDSVELVVSFTDNEGDIGLSQSDMQGFFKDGNLWMVYFYDSANTGIWAAYNDSAGFSAPFDTNKVPFSVPLVLPEGDPEEPMKGLIYAKQITKYSGVSTIVHNRIKYKVYMYDKALHKSNVIETPPLVFNP